MCNFKVFIEVLSAIAEARYTVQILISFVQKVANKKKEVFI